MLAMTRPPTEAAYCSLMNAVVRQSVHSNRRTRMTRGSAIVVMNFIGVAQAVQHGGLFWHLGEVASSSIFMPP